MNKGRKIMKAAKSGQEEQRRQHQHQHHQSVMASSAAASKNIRWHGDDARGIYIGNVIIV